MSQRAKNVAITIDAGKIRAARGERTQSEIAAAAGISQQLYQMVEGGKRADPRFSTVVRIARALRVTIESLTGRS